MTNTINDLLENSKNWQQVVIIPHTRPDGDAMGSALALNHFFRNKGIKSLVIAPTYYPEFLHWLPGNDYVWQFYQKQPQTTSVIQKADAVFCVDFNDLSRINEMGQLVRNHAKKIINIDHHLENKKFTPIQYVDTKASSTCELVYRFIEEYDSLDAITPDIAACLYTGIFTDTGGFKHNSTTPRTHLIAGDLMKRGANIEQIHDQLLNNGSVNRLEFLGHALSNRMKIYPMLKSAMIYVTREDAEKFQLESGDTEGLVNYPLGVKGIKFATLIKEDNGYVKFSFRSRGGFVVNEFARDHFNGGGHAQASGGRLESTLEKAIKTFEKTLSLYKEELWND